MKKQIRTSRVQYILVSAFIILVSLGTWISCSKDATVSSTDPTLRASKPALLPSDSVDFHPQSGVNYDPFDGMNEDDRKDAIGGRAAAEKYLRILVAQLAKAMPNDKTRHILHRVVPKVDNGEIHLAQIAAQHPMVLGVLSNGFKDAIDEKDPGGSLHLEAQNTESNGEAVLKVSKALCDLILTVVSKDGEAWDPGRAIPVFFSPLTDEQNTTVMEGVDTQQKAITVPFGRKKGPPVYLLVKADENSPMIDSNRNAIKVSMAPSVNGLWSSIFKSFNSIGLVSPVYAHDHHVSHGPHYGRIQPAREITIFVAHEDETKLDIKVDVRIRIKDVPGNNDWIHKQTFDLRDVDYINIPYRKYKNLTTEHGTAAYPNGYTIYWIRVYETDFWNADDEVCRWSEVYIQNPGSLYLPRWMGDRGIGEDGQGLHQDAETTIRKIAN